MQKTLKAISVAILSTVVTLGGTTTSQADQHADKDADWLIDTDTNKNLSFQVRAETCTFFGNQDVEVKIVDKDNKQYSNMIFQGYGKANWFIISRRIGEGVLSIESDPDKFFYGIQQYTIDSTPEKMTITFKDADDKLLGTFTGAKGVGLFPNIRGTGGGMGRWEARV